MNFDDLKERLISESQTTWERVKESSLYNQLSDRYENMTPAMQKMTLVGTATFISLVILSIPYSNFSLSQEHVTNFEEKRGTIRALLRASREAADAPQIPQAPPLDMIRSQIQEKLQMANLLPEQIRGTNSIELKSKIIPPDLADGALELNLAKLNLKQVLNLGYQLQDISPSVKLKDMVITANREDARYLDVIFKIVALAVPSTPEPSFSPPSEPKFKRGKKNISEEE